MTSETDTDTLSYIGREWAALANHMNSLRTNHRSVSLSPHQDVNNNLSLYCPKRLSDQDMDMFGFSPTKDALCLVVCLHCSKPIKASRFPDHFRRCPSRIPSARPLQAPTESSRTTKRKNAKELQRLGHLKRKKGLKQETLGVRKKFPKIPMPRDAMLSEESNGEDEDVASKNVNGLSKGNDAIPAFPGRGRGRGKLMVLNEKSRKEHMKHSSSLNGSEMELGSIDDPLHSLLRRAALPAIAAPLASRIYVRRNRLGSITLHPQEIAHTHSVAVVIPGPMGMGRALSMSGMANIMSSLATNAHPFAAINGFINGMHSTPGIASNGLPLKGQAPHVVTPSLLSHSTQPLPPNHAVSTTGLPMAYLRGIAGGSNVVPTGNNPVGSHPSHIPNPANKVHSSTTSASASPNPALSGIVRTLTPTNSPMQITVAPPNGASQNKHASEPTQTVIKAKPTKGSGKTRLTQKARAALQAAAQSPSPASPSNSSASSVILQPEVQMDRNRSSVQTTPRGGDGNLVQPTGHANGGSRKPSQAVKQGE